ncbi:MAG TPA: SRPBCC domain-containing protein [Flavisolibacter sp.]|nr:SRPBCC domain-containing protein [Flavisolibacter sp.]
MHKKLIRHEIIIHALPSKVWKILTSSEYAQQYMFYEELQSDWIKGSPILLETTNGNGSLLNRGLVQEVQPGISLEFTLFELPQFSDCPVQCRYELVPEDGGIRLILSQDVLLYSEKLYDILSDNCQVMLQKIKWLAEYS